MLLQPTSKGDHGRYRLTTSKGAFKQHTPVIPKKRQVAVNSKGDQEPIAVFTQSRVATSPNLPPFKAKIQPLDEPVAAQTRSSTVLHNYTTPSRSLALAAQTLTHAAYLVLDNDTGKLLNYGQLRKHPDFQETWNKSFSDEMGRS